MGYDCVLEIDLICNLIHFPIYVNSEYSSQLASGIVLFKILMFDFKSP